MLMMIYLNLLFLFFSSLKADVFIEENKKIAEAIKVYQLFLEGKEIDEIKREQEVHESVTNVHQALDYVIYLTETSLPGKIFGKKFDSCRIDSLEERELGLLSDSYANITHGILNQYQNEWIYKIPERMSCQICHRDEDCKKKSDEWRRLYLTENSPYRNYQKEKQKEFCLEMSQYAHNQATSGTVYEGGEKKDCPQGSLCATKYPYWSIVYTFDFKQCQEDFLICPEIPDSDKFIHPSCLGDNQHEAQEKLSWLGALSNSILSNCLNDLPIKSFDRQEVNLITCLDNNDENKLEGLINLDPSTLMNLKTKSSVIRFTDHQGKTYHYPASRFQLELDELNGKIQESKMRYENARLQFKEIGERFYDSTLKTYIYERKPGKASPDEFKKRKDELTNQEEAYFKLVEERKEHLKKELSTLSPQNKESYTKALESALLKDYGEIESYYYYDETPIKEKEIIIDSIPSEFPTSAVDQKLLFQFLSQQIKNLIITASDKKSSPKSVTNLSEAWAKTCIEKKLTTFGCNQPTLASPHCTTCPKTLSMSDLDTSDGNEIPDTKSDVRRNFYQQRRCFEYQRDLSEIYNPERERKIKKHLCSKEFKISNPKFKRNLPVKCEEN
jgi:hypothetical protein